MQGAAGPGVRLVPQPKDLPALVGTQQIDSPHRLVGIRGDPSSIRIKRWQIPCAVARSNESGRYCSRSFNRSPGNDGQT